jgi:2-oxoglutarate ferredoxin oxidoreductase subunit alpha
MGHAKIPLQRFESRPRMHTLNTVNDLVIRFANVNGTGSASANNLFAKAIFRMGIPVTPKNIFPSNIQGLPTWYEVRVNEQGYLGRRAGIDIMVAVNAQSFTQDVQSVRVGGYLVYDSTRHLPSDTLRTDIHYIGLPMMEICRERFSDPRQQQLLKNMVYVGALSALLDMDMEVIRELVRQQFKKNEKLVGPNFDALDAGAAYARAHFECPLGLRLEARQAVGQKIMIDGNTACALGALYAGATVAAWYPITPSTSVVNAFEKYAHKYRVDPATGKNNFAVVQAEDELAAIGMVIGATWNGARAFTATSGPGISLMSEFLGLAYFAEIPAVLIDVQRGGPSTGMPTRTQQSDILAAAYASHGDTRHVLLFPNTPKECFELTATAFDLAERLQTPVIVMTDLDLGMNDHLTDPLEWDDNRVYDRGKVYSAADLDQIGRFGRYLDVDGDGICYRTLPGAHPTKGSFFTRGSSRDEYAKYTENGAEYVKNVDRLMKKWATAASMVPAAELYQPVSARPVGMIFFGTSTFAALEALDVLASSGMGMDALRLRSFPFGPEVAAFIQSHERVFVVEQNRDAQMRSLLINELNVDPARLIAVLNYDGSPITAEHICGEVAKALPEEAY